MNEIMTESPKAPPCNATSLQPIVARQPVEPAGARIADLVPDWRAGRIERMSGTYESRPSNCPKASTVVEPNKDFVFEVGAAARCDAGRPSGRPLMSQSVEPSLAPGDPVAVEETLVHDQINNLGSIKPTTRSGRPSSTPAIAVSCPSRYQPENPERQRSLRTTDRAQTPSRIDQSEVVLRPWTGDDPVYDLATTLEPDSTVAQLPSKAARRTYSLGNNKSSHPACATGSKSPHVAPGRTSRLAVQNLHCAADTQAQSIHKTEGPGDSDISTAGHNIVAISVPTNRRLADGSASSCDSGNRYSTTTTNEGGNHVDGSLEATTISHRFGGRDITSCGAAVPWKVDEQALDADQTVQDTNFNNGSAVAASEQPPGAVTTAVESTTETPRVGGDPPRAVRRIKDKPPPPDARCQEDDEGGDNGPVLDDTPLWTRLCARTRRAARGASSWVKKNPWTSSAVVAGLILNLLALLLVVFLVLIPSIIQRTLNQTTITLTRALISNPLDQQFSLTADAVIRRPIGIGVSVQPVEQQVLYTPLPAEAYLDHHGVGERQREYVPAVNRLHDAEEVGPWVAGSDSSDQEDVSPSSDPSGSTRAARRLAAAPAATSPQVPSPVELGRMLLPTLRLSGADTSISYTTDFKISNSEVFAAFLRELMHFGNATWTLKSSPNIRLWGTIYRGSSFETQLNVQGPRLAQSEHDLLRLIESNADAVDTYNRQWWKLRAQSRAGTVVQQAGWQSANATHAAGRCNAAARDDQPGASCEPPPDTDSHADASNGSTLPTLPLDANLKGASVPLASGASAEAARQSGIAAPNQIRILSVNMTSSTQDTALCDLQVELINTIGTTAVDRLGKVEFVAAFLGQPILKLMTQKELNFHPGVNVIDLYGEFNSPEKFMGTLSQRLLLQASMSRFLASLMRGESPVIRTTGVKSSIALFFPAIEAFRVYSLLQIPDAREPAPDENPVSNRGDVSRAARRNKFSMVASLELLQLKFIPLPSLPRPPPSSSQRSGPPPNVETSDSYLTDLIEFVLQGLVLVKIKNPLGEKSRIAVPNIQLSGVLATPTLADDDELENDDDDYGIPMVGAARNVETENGQAGYVTMGFFEGELGSIGTDASSQLAFSSDGKPLHDWVGSMPASVQELVFNTTLHVAVQGPKQQQVFSQFIREMLSAESVPLMLAETSAAVVTQSSLGNLELTDVPLDFSIKVAGYNGFQGMRLLDFKIDNIPLLTAAAAGNTEGIAVSAIVVVPSTAVATIHLQSVTLELKYNGNHLAFMSSNDVNIGPGDNVLHFSGHVKLAELDMPKIFPFLTGYLAGRALVLEVEFVNNQDSRRTSSPALSPDNATAIFEPPPPAESGETTPEWLMASLSGMSLTLTIPGSATSAAASTADASSPPSTLLGSLIGGLLRPRQPLELEPAVPGAEAELGALSETVRGGESSTNAGMLPMDTPAAATRVRANNGSGFGSGGLLARLAGLLSDGR